MHGQHYSVDGDQKQMYIIMKSFNCKELFLQ